MGLTFEKVATLKGYAAQTDANLKALDTRVAKLESKPVKSVATTAPVPTKSAAAPAVKKPYTSKVVSSDIMFGMKGKQSQQYHQVKAAYKGDALVVTNLSSQRISGEWVNHNRADCPQFERGADLIEWFVKRVSDFEKNVAKARKSRKVEAIAAD